MRMKRRTMGKSVGWLVVAAWAVSLCAFGQNKVVFDNQSGDPALVRLIGPTKSDVQVPNGAKAGVDAAAGKYIIKVRYGTPGNYRYAKGEEFEVTETAAARSETTITLHKVVAGNYDAKPISEAEFGGGSAVKQPVTIDVDGQKVVLSGVKRNGQLVTMTETEATSLFGDALRSFGLVKPGAPTVLPSDHTEAMKRGEASGKAPGDVLTSSGDLARYSWGNAISDVQKLDASRGGSPDPSLKSLLQLLNRIKTGGDVNIRDGNGNTALVLATMYCDIEAVARLLVYEGADVNMYGKYSGTPLNNAVCFGSDSLVRLLIDKGSDVNLKDDYGFTPLHRAAYRDRSHLARLLIEKGADVNATNAFGNTALHDAAGQGSGECLRLLIEKGADVNAQNNNRSTALMEAARNGNGAVARLLIDKGADLNAEDKDGQTAQLLASAKSHSEIVDLLRKSGADYRAFDLEDAVLAVERQNGGSDDAASGALLTHLKRIRDGGDVNGKDGHGHTALPLAALKGQEALVRLLVAKGANVNSCAPDGSTALTVAAANGKDAIVRFLLDTGADVDRKSSDGSTPLMQAAANGHNTTVRLLLGKGADANARQKRGQTGLMWAAYKGNQTAVGLLLEKGADVNASDDDGNTVLMAAVEGGGVQMVNMLVEKGANVNAQNLRGETALLRAEAKRRSELVGILKANGAK